MSLDAFVQGGGDPSGKVLVDGGEVAQCDHAARALCGTNEGFALFGQHERHVCCLLDQVRVDTGFLQEICRFGIACGEQGATKPSEAHERLCIGVCKGPPRRFPR